MHRGLFYEKILFANLLLFTWAHSDNLFIISVRIFACSGNQVRNKAYHRSLSFTVRLVLLSIFIKFSFEFSEGEGVIDI